MFHPFDKAADYEISNLKGNVVFRSMECNIAKAVSKYVFLFESRVNLLNPSHVFRRFGDHDMDNIIAFDTANKALDTPLDRKVMCSSLMWSVGMRG